MKRLTLISLILILTACSGGQATKSAATETPSPATQTVEPTATNTPVPTETITPTPTEVPDPTAPLGEYGRDAEGVYVKMENGDIARKREFKTATGEILYVGWVVEKTQPGGISFVNVGPLKAIQAKLFINPNVPGSELLLSLTQVNNTAMSTTRTSITSAVGAALNKRPNIANANVSDFFDQLRKEGATIPIISSSDVHADVLLGPGTGVKIIGVPYNWFPQEMMATVTQSWEPYSGGNFGIRSTVLGVDAEGNAICLMAFEKPLNELPNELRDKLMRAYFLVCPDNIFRQEDQKEQGITDDTQVLILNADQNPGETEPDVIVNWRP